MNAFLLIQHCGWFLKKFYTFSQEVVDSACLSEHALQLFKEVYTRISVASHRAAALLEHKVVVVCGHIW